MKKILAFTAIRSEYDLLSSLYKLLNQEINIELKIIVSGAHLSHTYGYTVEDIENDKLDILARIETLIDSNSKSSRIKSASILFQSAIDIVSSYAPDLIIYGGDREEVIIASMIGGYLEIPTVHFFGGDHVKDSHIDNPIRHATSKLSSVHMVSTKEHYNRLLKMGEKKERIFHIGSIALDKFVNENIRSKDQIRTNFHIKKAFKSFAILIFHPIPKERNLSGEIFENILLELIKHKINTFVSYPNIDPGNKEIIKIIEKYKSNKNFIFYKSLPRNLFISIYKHSKLIIGNSSSGIMESASIPIPAINVGYRQTGRKSNENLIICKTERDDISKAIDKAFSKEFSRVVSNTRNIYGNGNSSKMAFELIKNNDFKELIFKNEDILEN
ncbi:MAG: UDP-N-acetylglucosamine 2-epimerase (hydrolyzing) [Arcobacter sp.]|nr:MAG: UDP-N-acetylglucosamine 2-epimerase (hydrolyzing) [Arcobacter sp.]